MNLQRIACDILDIKDAAFTLKQTGYLKATIELLPGIEQQALENGYYLGYKREQAYEHAIQQLRKDETLMTILGLSVMDHSDLISVIMDSITGDCEESEYELKANVEVIREGFADEDSTDEEELPVEILNFLASPFHCGMPHADDDSYYVDDQNIPIDPAYINLLSFYGSTFKDAPWLDGEAFKFAQYYCMAGVNERVSNTRLLRVVIENDDPSKPRDESPNEKAIKKYLKWWLGDYYEDAVCYIKDLYGLDMP